MNSVFRFMVIVAAVAIGSSAHAQGIFDGFQVQIGQDGSVSFGYPQVQPGQPGTVRPPQHFLPDYVSPYRSQNNITAIEDLPVKNRVRLDVFQGNSRNISETFSTKGATASNGQHEQFLRNAGRFDEHNCITKALMRMSHVTENSFVSNSVAQKMYYLNTKGYNFVFNQRVLIRDMGRSNIGNIAQSRYLIFPEMIVEKAGQNDVVFANRAADLKSANQFQLSAPKDYCELIKETDKKIEADPNSFMSRFANNLGNFESYLDQLIAKEKADNTQTRRRRRNEWRQDFLQHINYEAPAKEEQPVAL